MDCISKMGKEERTRKNCFIDIDKMVAASNCLLCKECTMNEIEREREKTVGIIANHLTNKGKTIPEDKEGRICVLTSLVEKIGDRRTNHILHCTKISATDKTVGLGLQTKLCCNNRHTFEVTLPNINVKAICSWTMK